jgi:hypothetical protein
MRSPTHILRLNVRQLAPAARLRLILLILALCVLACLLGIYSVPDVIATGRTYLAAVQHVLIP